MSKQRIPSYCPLCAGRFFTIDPIPFDDDPEHVEHYHMQCALCEEDICIYLFGAARKMSEIEPVALAYKEKVTMLLGLEKLRKEFPKE